MEERDDDDGDTQCYVTRSLSYPPSPQEERFSRLTVVRTLFLGELDRLVRMLYALSLRNLNFLRLKLCLHFERTRFSAGS